MTNQQEFYQERADEARRDAEAASLHNVRERCLRAATAWEQMASRAKRTARNRAETEARKAAEATAQTDQGDDQPSR